MVHNSITSATSLQTAALEYPSETNKIDTSKALQETNIILSDGTQQAVKIDMNKQFSSLRTTWQEVKQNLQEIGNNSTNQVKDLLQQSTIIIHKKSVS